MSTGFVTVWLALLSQLCSFQLQHSVRAQSRAPASDIGTMIDSTMEETYNYRFAIALNITDRMIASYPKDPEGYLYKCAVYWKTLEEGCGGSVDSVKREIKLLTDEACELSAAKIHTSPNDVTGLFHYAGSLVYRARYEATQNDWFSVMTDGTKTRRLLNKVIELDSNFYDAYSGLGAFNYYAAHIPWYLKPVAFILGIAGNEAEGILQLEKASQYGKYSSIEATEFLATVVDMNKKDYANAAKLMLGLHHEYPRNPYFVRCLCSAYFELRDYSDVTRCADSALVDYLTPGSCSGTSVEYIHYYRGASYERLNQKDKAIADYEIVVKGGGDDYACRQAKEALDRLKEQ